VASQRACARRYFSQSKCTCFGNRELMRGEGEQNKIMKMKNKTDRINRRKFVSHLASGTVLAFGMGVMAPRASAGVGPINIGPVWPSSSEESSNWSASESVSISLN
jgi:hypothetical protein